MKAAFYSELSLSIGKRVLGGDHSALHPSSGLAAAATSGGKSASGVASRPRTPGEGHAPKFIFFRSV
jgi:hypothetical protein